MDSAEILQKLVDLQGVDSGLDELERLKKSFQQEGASLDGAVAELKAAADSEKRALEGLLKDRKTLEIEIGTLESKAAKYLGQQNEVKNNDQFLALKHEIEKAKEDKGKAEEGVLEILLKEDERKQALQDLAVRLAEAEKKGAEGKKELALKIGDCEKAAASKKEERKAKAALVREDLAAVYGSLRSQGKKVAVAEVREDLTCGGCHMNVPPQVLNEIRKGLEIQRCNCGRFLYIK